MRAAGSLGVAAVSAGVYFFLDQDLAKYGVLAGMAVAILSVMQSAGAKHRATKC